MKHPQYLRTSRCQACWFPVLMALLIFGCQRQTEAPAVKAAPVEPPAHRVPEDRVLANQAVRITFSPAEQGLGCTGITTTTGGTFVKGLDQGESTLWKLKFAAVADDGEMIVREMTNQSPAQSVRFERLPDHGTVQRVRLTWKQMDLHDEKDAIDVIAWIDLYDDGRSEWRIKIANRSVQWGLWNVQYPCLNTVSAPGEADVLKPGGFLGGSLEKKCRIGKLCTYPAASMPVQFCAFMVGDDGLYLGAHDNQGLIKKMRITDQMDVAFEQYPLKMMVPGEGYESLYPICVQPFRGDWWDAAKIYRAWAVQHLVTEHELLANRDIPVAFKESGVTMQMWQSPARVADYMIQFQKYLGVPVTGFWCEWGGYGFDKNAPEFFPAREGMADAVKRIREDGGVAMPYVNPRLWGADNAEYETKQVQDSLARDPRGMVATEYCGAVYCPTTWACQDKAVKTSQRLIREIGANAIYVDQVGAAEPVFCFVTSHGHQPGAVKDWSRGYHQYVAKLRATAAQCKQPLALFTETFTDAYVKDFDGALPCWWQEKTMEDAVPLFEAVYSGYVTFGPNADNRAIQSLDGYVYMQGRFYLWGMQGSVHQGELEGRPGVCEDIAAAHAFLRTAARVRYAAKHFMVYGELLRELPPTNQLPPAHILLKSDRKQTASERVMTDPAVRASLWRSLSGDIGIAMVNFTSQPQTFEYQVNPGQWSPAHRDTRHWRVSELTAEGEVNRGTCGAVYVGKEHLPPHGMRFIAMRPQE